MRACVAAALAACLGSACAAGLAPRHDGPRPVARPSAKAVAPAAPAPAPQAPAPVLVPQTGHVSPVTSVAFDPTGRFLATGSRDETVCIWDLDGGLVAQLVGHEATVTRVAWSADGKVLASVASDERVIVWDLSRFAPRQVLDRPGRDLALSADGKRVWVAGEKAELSVHDAETGKRLDAATTPGGEGRHLVGVALSADGASLATASVGGVVHLWNASPLGVRARFAAPWWRVAFAPDGRLAGSQLAGLHVLDGATASPLWLAREAAGMPHIAWSPDGRWLFAGGGRELLVLDGASGRVTAKYPVGKLTALAVSSDGSLLATGGDGLQARLWRADTGAPLRALGAGWNTVSAARFDPTGDRIAVATSREIDVWDARTGTILVRLSGKGEPTWDPRWSPDGALLAANTGSGAVTVWDASSGAELGTIPASPRDIGRPSFVFAPDSSVLAVFTSERLSSWDRRRRKVVKTVPMKGTSSAGIDWRGGVVAVAGPGSVELLDAPSLTRRHTPDVRRLAREGAVQRLELSVDGRRVLVALGEHVGVWDTGSGELVARLEGRALHAPPVFSPDGTRVAFPDVEHRVVVWDGTETREVLRVDAALRRLRWSPDGERLAVATDDGRILVVHVATRRLERTLSEHERRISSLDWHPSGRVLLATSHQARLHRVTDGGTVTLRARQDRAGGVVHSTDAFVGDGSLLRRRVGAGLAQATLTEPGPEQPDLLSSFWR